MAEFWRYHPPVGLGSTLRRCRAPVALVLLGPMLALPSPSGAAGPSTGALDSGFGQAGKVLVAPPAGAGEWPGAQAIQPDGKIVVAGTAAPARSGYVVLLLRFLPDGKLDPSFGTGGRVWSDLVTLDSPLKGAVVGDVALGSSSGTSVAVQPDGKIVVGGATQSGASTAFAVLRYLADGRPDEAFGSGGLVVTDFDAGTDDGVGALAVLPDGRILAAGAAGATAALARYRPDGQLDPTFGPGRDGTVRAAGRGLLNALSLGTEPGGKLIVAGQAGTPGGPFDFGAARFSGDGVLDDSFGDRGVVSTDLGSTGEWAAGVASGPGGTVIAAGASGSSFAVVRYLGDGRLDRGFGAGGITKAGPDLGGAHALVPLVDGRLLLVGERLVGDTRQVTVARYRPDGALDPTFGHDGAVDTDVTPVHDDGTAAALYPGGRMVVAGTSLDAENTNPRVFLVRYTEVDG